MCQYVDVIAEPSTPTTLTYSTGGIVVNIGARVTVSVNGRRYAGIVVRCHNIKPPYRTLPIKEVIDTGDTLITEKDIELWRWVWSYYMTTPSTVYKAAMPGMIRTDTFNYPYENYLKLSTSEAPEEVLRSLHRSPKQEAAFAKFLELSQSHQAVARRELQHYFTQAIIAELCRKNILRVVRHEERLLSFVNKRIEFNGSNREIADKIADKFSEHDRVLLFEKESIDKLEIYCHLAIEMASQQKQMLILMPDGYSSETLYDRMNEVLGGGIAAYYPTMSQNQRATSYIRSVDQAAVVIGSRGAVFLPMRRLGLVVIEQEQDAAYKNRESAPRLNVRDVALVKAAKAGAKVLLTSEAPSVESYYNATRGDWAMVETNRDTKRVREFMVLERGKELLSTYLRHQIEKTIERGEQVLVFQNRRGFSIWVECSTCGSIPTCNRCNVSLTYHKTDNTLRCHYCGFQQPFLAQCSQCGSAEMEFQGRGTERIEQSLREIFPQAGIVRMDYDSTRGRGSYEQIAASVSTASCDIIVGTQMVIRGIDFTNISLVGIVNADNMLSQADFRTSERAFTLLTQLSNRVGARNGQVVIQTTKRIDTVIKSVEQSDPAKFYESELREREALNYPPFVRMMSFTFEHKDRTQLLTAAQRFESLLRPSFGNRLSPPFEPTIDRKNDNYLIEFYLRIERAKSVVRAKEIVGSAIASMQQWIPSIRIISDVDPI